MSHKKILLNQATKIELRINDGKSLVFEDNNIIGFIESKVSKFGNSAKIGINKEFLKSPRVYVVICK